MADPFDQNSGDPFGGLFHGVLTGAISLAPIGVAGALAAQRVKSNTPLNPLGGGGAINQIGAGVGKELKSASKISKARQQKTMAALTADILKSNGAREFLEKAQHQNAVIQALISTVGDPAAGIDQAHLLSFKEKLLDIASGAMQEGQADEILEGLVKGLFESGSEYAKKALVGNLREFEEVGAVLTAPIADLTSGSAFQKIGKSSLSDKSKSHYKALRDHFGNKSDSLIKLVEGTVGGVKQQYARVYGKPNSRNWLATVPLDMGGSTHIRMGENLQTPYLSNSQHIGGAREALDFMRSNRGASVSDLLGHLKTQNAGFGLEGFGVQSLISSSVVTGDGAIIPMGRNAYNAGMRQYASTGAGIRATGYTSESGMAGMEGLTAHLQSAQQYQNRYMTFHGAENLSKSERQELATMFAGNEGFEAGASKGRSISPDRKSVSVGLAANAPINALKTVGIRNRAYVPVEARLEQVTGRESYFVGQPGVRMGKGGVFHAGGTMNEAAERIGANVEWSSQVTGATNKAMLMDVSGDIQSVRGKASHMWKALEGQGAAYHTGAGDRMVGVMTKPVLQPKATDMMSTKLLNRLINAGRGNSISLTADELTEHAAFLGVGPNGLQMLRNDPRLTDMTIGISEISEVGTGEFVKKQYHTQIKYGRNMETSKIFSTLMKGTLQQQGSLMQMLADRGINADFLGGWNIPEQHLVAGTGDMLGKASAYIDVQMLTAFSGVTGMNIDEATKVLSHTKNRAVGPLFRSNLAKSELGRTTQSMITGLATRKIDPAQAAGVLVGSYAKGGKFSSLEGKGKGTATGAWRKAMNQAIVSGFGKVKGAEVIRHMNTTSMAVGFTSATAGTGIGDYGRGRGSIEPRTIQFLQKRLRNMGVDVNQTSEFIADIMKRKPGWQDSFASAKGLFSTVESLMGERDLVGEIAGQLDGVKRLNMDQLNEIMGKHANFSDYLQTQKSGVILDLAGSNSSPGQRAISAAATNVTGKGEVYLSGADTMNAMRGTDIKTAGGSVEIHGRYAGAVNNFVSNLTGLSTQPEGARQASEKLIGGFKENMTELFANTQHQLASGKIKGMIASIGGVYDIEGGSSFTMGKNDMTPTNSMRHKLAKKATRVSKGRAVFANSVAFLDMIKDEGVKQGSGSAKNQAYRAELFFTSMESGTRTRGIAGLAMRHPQLGLGNVAPAQIFRHAEEAKRGAGDATFKAFTESGTGKTALRDLQKSAGKQITSFEDIARLRGQGKAKRSFFGSMVGSLGEFHKTTGGGQVFFGRNMRDAHFGGVSASIDTGFMAAAIGDVDGDFYQLAMVNRKGGNLLMGGMKHAAGNAADDLYKLKSEAFTRYAKKGLQNVAQKMGSRGGMPAPGTPAHANWMAKQGVLKEMGTAAATGPLDVRLNDLRAAVANAPSSSMADEALGLLKVIEEHSTIKGKKLPIYTDIAGRLGQSVTQLMDTGDASALKTVLKQDIFYGTGMAGEAGVEVGFKGEDSHRIKLDPLVDFIQEQTRAWTKLGGGKHTTAARTAASLAKSPGPSTNNINAGQGSLQNALSYGFGDDRAKQMSGKIGAMADSVMGMGSHIDKRTMGLASMGIMGSLGAAAMMGHQGYSSTPLEMPGEYTNPRVQEEIASGNLFSNSGGQVAASSMGGHGGDQYAMMNRVINPRTTVMSRSNSYQVRGELSNSSGISAASDYIHSLTGGIGSRHVSINDTRRPITSNYVDRLLGNY